MAASGGLIRDAHACAELLTEREREVLALMAEGCSNRLIASRLFLSERTVEAHVRTIFLRLDLPPEATTNRRVAAVLTYIGLLPAPG